MRKADERDGLMVLKGLKGSRSRRGGGEHAGTVLEAPSGCQQLVSPPPALLTVLRTLTALCGVRHVLLADAVLVRLPVSARAGADPGLEAAAAQHLTAGVGGEGRGGDGRQRDRSEKSTTGGGEYQPMQPGSSLTLWFPR